MGLSTKEIILMGVLLLAAVISPLPAYLDSQISHLVIGKYITPSPEVVPSANPGDPITRWQLDEIIARVNELNAAGEYGKSLDLLDESHLKNSAGKDIRIKNAFLKTYDLYIQDMIQKGEFTEAIRILENKIDVDPDHSDEINRQIVDTYILRLERDKSKHFFKEALDTINFTLPKYASYDPENRIQKIKVAILEDMSKDDGVDGRNALEDTIKDICTNRHVTKTEYQSYLGTDPIKKKIIACDQNFDLGASLMPETLSEIRYVFDFQEKKKKLAPCTYFGFRYMNHIRVDWKVGLIDVQTGEVVYQRDFIAPVTDCPVTLKFNKINHDLVDRPDRAEVFDYLKSIVQ